MRQVFKYPLTVGAALTAVMLRGIVVHVGIDPQGELCLWAEHDEQARETEQRFAVVGTGHQVPAGGRYVGSASHGLFVWHVYEVARYA
jgi:hypothetical protein